MQMGLDVRLARLAVPALALALVAGCGGDSAAPAPSATPTPTPSPSSSPTAVPTPSATLPAGVDQLVSFTVRNGKVVDARTRTKVKRGTRVRLVVTSDVADEVHLHGYDKTFRLKAGGTVHLDFTANIPGVFEAELHDAGLVLTSFQVR